MSEPFRVLHLRASNFFGGPERQVVCYARFEQLHSIKTIVGTFMGPHEGREFMDVVEQHGLETLRLPTGLMGRARALSTLSDLLAERRISLVCTHGYLADIMGTLAGRRRGVPVAWFLHGWTGEDWKVRVYEALDRALLPLATRVVCLSQAQAHRFVHRWTIGNKIRVVVNAVEARTITQEERLRARQLLSDRLALPVGCPLVATAGRLSPEKGVCYFIDALPAIRIQFPDVRFIVFGDGPLRGQLEEMARRLDLRNELIFAGYVPDFPLLLPGVDVFVNPSLSEVAPVAVLESMASGVPVVATNVGGVPEIAGADGLVLVPPSDSPCIAGAVSALLSDPSRAREQGNAGQRRVREAFSPARQSEQLWALYRELIPSLSSTPATPGLTSEAGALDRADA